MIEQFQQQNKAVLNYNPNYKINIYEFMLILKKKKRLNKSMGRRDNSKENSR